MDQPPNEISTFVNTVLPMEGSASKEATRNSQAVMEELVRSFTEELLSKGRSEANKRGSATITDSDLKEAYRTMSTPYRRNRTRMAIGDGFIILGSLIAANVTTSWWALTGLPLIAAGLYIQWIDGG